MGDKSYRSALVALCTALIPATADAQNVAADRIDAIERQIRNLQSDLQQLKNELGEAKQQLRQSRSEAQRAKEEALQAQAAAERARQDAVRAATAESQPAQAVAQAVAIRAQRRVGFGPAGNVAVHGPWKVTARGFFEIFKR